MITNPDLRGFCMQDSAEVETLLASEFSKMQGNFFFLFSSFWVSQLLRDACGVESVVKRCRLDCMYLLFYWIFMVLY